MPTTFYISLFITKQHQTIPDITNIAGTINNPYPK